MALARSGFVYVSVSGRLTEAARRRGIRATRAGLQDLGADLLYRKGPEWYSDWLLKNATGRERVVIDGIRPASIVRAIRRRCNNVLIVYLSATLRNRCLRKRLQPDQYKRMSSVPIESGVAEIRHLADSVLNNNADLPAFQRRFLALVSQRFPQSGQRR